MLTRVQAGLEGVARGAAIIGGLAMCCAAIMVTLDVIARKLFGVTMRGSDEITGYVFAAATTWSYAFCLLTRSNIRIDVAYLMLGTQGRALLDLLGLGLMTLYIFLLTRSAWSVVEESWTFTYTAQTPMATPLWIPQSFWFAGLAFMLLCLAFLSLRTLHHLVHRNWSGINAVAGVRSIEQDIKEETHA
ncbi:MAG: TRAP transporter small permease [Pseudomonadota bacterium]